MPEHPVPRPRRAATTPAPRAPHAALVVGTAESLPPVVAAALLTPGAPFLAGCLLVGPPDGEGREVECVPVLGDVASLPEALGRTGAGVVLLALPASLAEERERLRARLEPEGVRVVAVTPMAEMLSGEARPAGARRGPVGPPPLDLEALVGRRSRPVDEPRLRRLMAGRRVLITGAGGSIGSELARLCARFGPESILLMERSENALFEIDRVLRERHPGVRRVALLHDVTEEGRTLDLLLDHRPEIVFHAAAHKHVPLMEDHPAHAVVNNVFGTRSIADAAVAAGAARFVMISSDKAVNPTSVMGATKRLAEMYVQSLNRAGGRTRLSMVRFGNVLGSACSVLPIWGAQLADGGPMTVTDPRMTRYFMTIPEAASLVASSATLDSGEAGDVFVLDMGEPVRILDLAQRFARAHGLEPVVRGAGEPSRPEPGRVEIVLSGARPGEKLFEELSYASEQVRPTPLPGVLAWTGIDPPEDMDAVLRDLADACATGSREAVVEAIRRGVPEMAPPAAARAA